MAPLLHNDAVERWPRILRWGINNRDNVGGQMRFKSSVMQEQLEMRSPESIIWQPFMELAQNQFPAAVVAHDIAQRRYMLFDPELGGSWYLGDRCYRQMTSHIAIPNNPLYPMAFIPLNIYMQHIGNWQPAIANVTITGQDEWLTYWRAVTKGPILPSLIRWQNHDGVGFASIVPHDLRVPIAPTDRWQAPHSYNTQGQPSSSSLIPLSRELEVTHMSGIGTTFIQVDPPSTPNDLAPADFYSREQWRDMVFYREDYIRKSRSITLEREIMLQRQIREKDQEIANLRGAGPSSAPEHYPIPQHTPPYIYGDEYRSASPNIAHPPSQDPVGSSSQPSLADDVFGIFNTFPYDQYEGRGPM